MDALDKKIVAIVKDDARFSAATIAEMLETDEKVVAERLTTLENAGIIVKYTAVVNHELTGEEGVTALIEVKVTPQMNHGFDSIAKDVMKFSNVSSVYLMSGGYDLAVIVEGKTLREVSLFVSENLSVMENVISTATHFILKKYKSDGVVLERGGERKREMWI